ncbi:hypothetical protein AJ88_34940 [Mesorhizobium amorphae CCBAU 01583]|nr:hypothetical protein AJ88_34940 [Mesorhizobium amorphae CCBAU 01583]
MLGMLDRFNRAASLARGYHRRLLDTGLPVVGIEPVAVLMHEVEYRMETATDTDGDDRRPWLRSLESFLSAEIEAGNIPAREPQSDLPSYELFLHCTERTANPQSAVHWRCIFSTFGLRVQTPSTGCCGMAGLFGHEREHAALSEQVFAMSWAARLAEKDQGHILATGFSCRCQTKRFAGFKPRHPAEALVEHLARRGRIGLASSRSATYLRDRTSHCPPVAAVVATTHP